jgi:DNA-binding CsgD family transcriptional regulator/tetratricopeptide (TPR) repeat protein
MPGTSHSEQPFDAGRQWREALAVAVVAGDTSIAGIARFNGLHAVDAAEVVTNARAAGLLDDDGQVDAATTRLLAAELSADRAAVVHAAAARHLFAGGPDRLLDALAHARAAGSLLPLDELVDLADRGGRLSLSIGDYRAAHDLLALAASLDNSTDFTAQGERLCELARACDGLGDIVEARSHLAQAVALGELAERGDLVARAAVQYAFPADWYAGDPRSSGLLQRAEHFDLSHDDAVAVTAARALVEMRIPMNDDGGHQMAWITRASVAQGVAEDALDRSTDSALDVRLIALQAWRGTHRAPDHLRMRRQVSSESLDIAQRLRHPGHQVDAAVWLATDALESGDRARFDEALAVARWVAARDGNPRLLWRAYLLAAGAAHLDGDLDQARTHRAAATEVGRSIGSPGWLGAELLMICQELATTDDPEEMRPFLPNDEVPALDNPIGRAVLAYGLARIGDTDGARHHARRARRQLDPEASYLLLATRLAAVAMAADDAELVDDLIAVLSPWSEHVAVDSNSWWCDGPVAVWLGMLHMRRGENEIALDLLARGETTARALNDVRSLRRVRTVRAGRSDIAPTRSPGDLHGLTPREVEVLGLMASGATNPEIARRLAFSASTIRTDTIAIYRKLGVKGRAEAVARAITLGVVAPSGVAHAR